MFVASSGKVNVNDKLLGKDMARSSSIRTAETAVLMLLSVNIPPKGRKIKLGYDLNSLLN